MDELGDRALARTTLQLLHRLMLDAESGQRGYLLTGRSSDLVPYREANEEIQNTLKVLHKHFDGSASPAALLKQLERLVQNELSELQTSISLYDQDKHDNWRAGADRHLPRADGQHPHAVDPPVLALLMYLRQTAALEQQRSEQQRLIQIERDQLENQVARRTAQLREHAQRTGVEMNTQFDAGLQLSGEAELTAYRLVQEALTNATKYAEARRIEVRLLAEAGAARVQVIDDGAGFAPQDTQHSSHGLPGMGHRVESCGGHLQVHSAPGRGTRIEALLPTAPAASASTDRRA